MWAKKRFLPIQTMKREHTHKFLYSILCGILLLPSCSVQKFLAEEEYLLDKVEILSNNKEVKPSEFTSYIRQNPNTRWLGKFKIPMGIYAIAGTDSTKPSNRFWKRLGEAPVIYNATKAEESRVQIENAVRNKGYLSATVKQDTILSKRKKLKATYQINTGIPYLIGGISREYENPLIAQKLSADSVHSLIKVGEKLDVNKLDEERTRIARLLQDQGYFTFHKEYLSYQADTIQGSKNVFLTLKQQNNPFQEEDVAALDTFSIRNINFLLDTESIEQFNENPLNYNILREDPYLFYFQGKKPFLRKKLLQNFNYIAPYSTYKYSNVEKTYAALNRLGILRSYHIHFERNSEEKNALDAYILLSRQKNKAFSFEIEGTNSAGDLGVAAGVGFTHRNVFRGGENFNLKLRGAYETITGLEEYAGSNYKEYGIETSLTFPEFKFPFLSRNFKRKIAAVSEVSAKYNWQIRPEFSRTLAAATWSYKWNTKQKYHHRVDLIDINYIYMPYRSQTFIDYLNSMEDLNPLLRFSYENQLIARMGYTFTYNSVGGSMLQAARKNSYSIRLNIEEAGNILYLFSKWVNKAPKEGESYKMANINFAQYIKGDIEYTKNYFIDSKNALVFHAGLGIAYPYGNSKILPFEKLYFSGGANSVRGWRVRSLGPGGYGSNKAGLDYVNHTGDLKLDFNIEYRTHLFWKLNGALFVDAGNIWTLHPRAHQTDGNFKFNKFYKQIAVSYGAGFRFDFDFLILRFDAGMKAINPMHTGKERYPLFHPKFSRDFAFHFAVGYPF